MPQVRATAFGTDGRRCTCGAPSGGPGRKSWLCRCGGSGRCPDFWPLPRRRPRRHHDTGMCGVFCFLSHWPCSNCLCAGSDRAVCWPSCVREQERGVSRCWIACVFSHQALAPRPAQHALVCLHSICLKCASTQEMYEKPRQAANMAMTTALDGLARAFRVQVRNCASEPVLSGSAVPCFILKGLFFL